jgi:hypothetical protein
MKFCVVLLAFVVYVSAHAVSRQPPAWNPNPSTSQPCGNGQITSVAVMTLTQGKPFEIKWEVVAADGSGPVTVLLDLAGTQNFASGAVNIPVTGTTPNGVGTYTFTATAPAVTCKGPNGACTMQLKSSSGWYSCATVNIIDPNNPNATVAPTLPPNCQPASQLTFCDWMNGQNVYLPPGQISAISLDWAVKSAYNQYLGNLQVFRNPYSPGCQAWFKKLICGLNFQPCGANYGQGGCNQACLNTNNFCSVDPSHVTLYNCSKITNTVSDLTGNCNGAGSIQISAAVLIMSAIFVIFALLL